ncbi:MAG: hypothetical protein Q8S22_11145 [Eubacteriales bacterium]|nr:hypothetical protein [Eubacteriales bacterium]
MQTANVQPHNRNKSNLRTRCAGLSAARAALARAERLPAMRMRQHAKQADAAAAAL